MECQRATRERSLGCSLSIAYDISGAFITLTAGLSLTLEDYTLLGDLIEPKVSEDCIIVIGTVLEPSFDEIKQVSVVFTGPELY